MVAAREEVDSRYLEAVVVVAMVAVAVDTECSAVAAVAAPNHYHGCTGCRSPPARKSL